MTRLPSSTAFVLSVVLGSLTISAQDPKRGNTYEASESVASLVAGIDVSCILRTWRITGVLACPSPMGGIRTCVIVENAYPAGVLEVVRRPFTSHLAEFGSVAAAFRDLPKFGITSSHTSDAASGTGLQFAEAHAFEFVPEVPLASMGIPLAIPSGQLFSVSTVSEVDGFLWRTGLAEVLADPAGMLRRAGLPSCSAVPRTEDCAWSWGSYFPRIGFLSHPSEVMAAHVQGLRAGRIGARPLGHAVLAPYPYEPRTGHYIQMVQPARRACVSIGWPLTRPIEAQALSKEGAYLWIHFGVFRECRGCLPTMLVEPRVPAP